MTALPTPGQPGPWGTQLNAHLTEQAALLEAATDEGTEHEVTTTNGPITFQRIGPWVVCYMDDSLIPWLEPIVPEDCLPRHATRLIGTGFDSATNFSPFDVRPDGTFAYVEVEPSPITGSYIWLAVV